MGIYFLYWVAFSSLNTREREFLVLQNLEMPCFVTILGRPAILNRKGGGVDLGAGNKEVEEGMEEEERGVIFSQGVIP